MTLKINNTTQLSNSLTELRDLILCMKAVRAKALNERRYEERVNIVCEFLVLARLASDSKLLESLDVAINTMK